MVSVRGLMLVVATLAMMVGVAACGRGDEVEPTLSEHYVVDRILSHAPQWAGGFSISDLASGLAGGTFDCADPENLQEPQEISHSVIDDVSFNDGVWTVVLRFYNEPETITETATFVLDEETQTVGAADDQAATFLDVTHPSEDNC
jgi:hypothetical protein